MMIQTEESRRQKAYSSYRQAYLTVGSSCKPLNRQVRTNVYLLPSISIGLPAWTHTSL